MIRISSSLTLVLSIFIPVFWFVFFGSLCLFFVFQDPEDLPFSNPIPFKIGFVCFYLFFGFWIYYLLFQLRRIELDDANLYITNYFKTIKVPLTQVESISILSVIGIKRVKIKLSFKSSLGTKIRFICDDARLTYFKTCLDNSKAT